MPLTNTLSIDCEQCGHSSAPNATACEGCSEKFAFVSQAVTDWQPRDYSAWLFSRHFQICKLVDESGYDALSRPQQLNYLVGYLYYQYMNGGLWQYIENPCGADASLLHAALLEIKAPKTADLIAQLLTHFPNNQPQLDENERAESLDKISEADWKLLDKKADKIINAELPEMIIQLKNHLDKLAE
jgi:Domain of unknown function (DUF4375)